MRKLIFFLFFLFLVSCSCHTTWFRACGRRPDKPKSKQTITSQVVSNFSGSKVN